MCGIAGLFDRAGRADLGRLRLMSELMRHRGPDDEGLVLVDPRGGQSVAHGGADTPAAVFTSGLPWAPGRVRGDAASAVHGLGLVHRRLAIVDLQPTGHQPQCDADGGDWIVYNGEVYNHVELREELSALGQRFLGSSDTEVILAAYRRWGEDCLRRFNGMFALAIWDGARRRLFLARDRLGVKPLYYQDDGVRFAFASEPAALVLTQAHAPRPHLPAIRDLLALDWVDHDAHTFFEGLWQLPAGHWLAVDGGGPALHRWWGLDAEARAPGRADAWAAELAARFTDAVALRLRADVEVGSCLSGGLDSSAVITTAARLANAGLHAFSCAYDEGPAFDERPYVRAAVEASGATSHVVVPDGSDLWSVFDALVAQQAEPTAGPGVYSQWKVMQLAHAGGLKVLLDGQGGDEVFAGYFRYLPTRLRDLLAAGDLAGFARLWGGVADRLGFATALLHTFEPWLPPALVEGLRRRWGQGKDRVLARALRRLPPTHAAPPRAARSGLWRQLAFDTLARQLPGLLRYEDRNSMAFGIETRLPFLDYRLVEMAFALPDETKLAGTTTKAILRRALGDRVPRAVLERRDKMGFETPADVWLRERYAGEVRRRLARRGPFREWVDGGALGADLDAYLAGRRDNGLQVWRWLSLEAWAERFVARDPRVTAREPEPILHAGRHVGYAEGQSRRERELEAGVPGG
ncbi:MAG TPA: asparagine synthase (glutamine-hydrolyzing) [Candidatus Eisenbacteria bacterium]|nr:asparagine synthase (glutamine-hydrolyzing) [Candidatus Eisenbacteria bacterium]